jgi:hypothetical protein
MNSVAKINQCVEGLRLKEIERVFGRPHEIKTQLSNSSNTIYYYYLMSNCYDLKQRNSFCQYYYFDFNSSGECNSLNFGGEMLMKSQ